MTDIAGFADIKSGSNLNECLDEIVFVTSEMNDPSELLTENARSDTFKAPCCCFENAPNTALTIVCTINVSIDCNWFDVPNLPQKKNILK